MTVAAVVSPEITLYSKSKALPVVKLGPVIEVLAQA